MFNNSSLIITQWKKRLICILLAYYNSSIIRNFFIYSFGSILLRSISFLMAPVLLKFLSPADFGLLALLTSFNNIFIVFLGFGLRQAFSLEYFHHTPDNRRIIINEIIYIYLILGIPFALLAFLAMPFLQSYFFSNAAKTPTIILALCYCFLSFFAEFFFQILQYQQQALHLILVQTASALVIVVCNLLFLFLFNLTVQSIMFGYFLSMVISCSIAAYFYIKCDYKKTFNLKIKKKFYYLKLGLPFIPGVLCGWILASGDRWVLTRYGTLHDVGIYSLADMFGSAFQMLVLYPMSCSYIPAVLEKFSNAKKQIIEIEQWNKKNMYMSMIGMVGIIMSCYWFFQPLILHIIPYKYHQAIPYIWLILLGNIFFMGTYFASILIQFHKKSSFLAFALFIPACANILLNMAMIPKYKMYGCVFATVLSYAGYFAIIVGYNYHLLTKLQRVK